MSTPPPGRRLRVRVPASSANLGPGFDVLAAAVSLHLELEIVQTGSFAVRTKLDVPKDRSNLLVRAFELLHPADQYEFRISSEIPLSGGLGSSAAAIVAGLRAGDHLAGGNANVLAMAIELEGHPDNVAAALQGGFVICDGQHVRRFEAPSGLTPVLVVPDRSVRTSHARAALPEQVPLADARFNVAAVAQLVLGLASEDWDLLAAGLRDRLHQPYRARLYARSARLLEKLPELGALGATISGAGPTVLVWVLADRASDVVRALEPLTRGWARVIPTRFESRGAQVTDMV
ncbi:MAG: homoserine kinase [Solirubrobacteraceae bacterium]